MEGPICVCDRWNGSSPGILRGPVLSLQMIPCLLCLARCIPDCACTPVPSLAKAIWQIPSPTPGTPVPAALGPLQIPVTRDSLKLVSCTSSDKGKRLRVHIDFSVTKPVEDPRCERFPPVAGRTPAPRAPLPLCSRGRCSHGLPPAGRSREQPGAG